MNEPMNEPMNEKEAWRMRYEHEIIREVPVERRVIVLDPEDVMEGVLPADTGEPYATARPDFARGQEADPARIERFVEDRFSRGLERDPLLHQQVHQGRLRHRTRDAPASSRGRAPRPLRARPAAERPRQSERGTSRLVVEPSTSRLHYER